MVNAGPLLSRIRGHATYANATATLALFVALGTGAYAAVKIDSGDIKNRSIKGADVARDALSGAHVNESKLGTVPSAATAENAATVQGSGLSALKVHCPPDTDAHAGVCFERVTRVAAFEPYIKAIRDCGTDQRRLPTTPELAGYLLEPGVESNGIELTGDLFKDRDQQLHVLTVFDSPANVVSVGDRRARSDLAEEMTQLIYRCVAQPSN